MIPLSGWLILGYMSLVAISGIGLLIWGWRNDAFKNIEEPKYRMMEDREPEPWPGREENK